MMATRLRFALSALASIGFVGTLAACGSSGGGGASGPAPEPCTSGMLPDTVQLTVTGFQQCSCFNGTFALTRQTAPLTTTTWASPPIMGCPGQSQTAYLEFSIAPNAFGVGVAAQGSDPGSGDSDFSPTRSGTCSPLSLNGGGSVAGNITSFCHGNDNEDEYFSWSLRN